MHNNQIDRNKILCDDPLRYDTQLKVAHCSIACYFRRSWSTNCGNVPQIVEMFHFVSVFLDTAKLPYCSLNLTSWHNIHTLLSLKILCYCLFGFGFWLRAVLQCIRNLIWPCWFTMISHKADMSCCSNFCIINVV